MILFRLYFRNTDDTFHIYADDMRDMMNKVLALGVDPKMIKKAEMVGELHEIQ